MVLNPFLPSKNDLNTATIQFLNFFFSSDSDEFLVVREKLWPQYTTSYYYYLQFVHIYVYDDDDDDDDNGGG